MALKLRNTLSGRLEVFEPQGGTVKMYSCGPTVYDRQTIGNLRGILLANTLRRSLEAFGYKVSHVSNITDVGHLVSDADLGEDKLEAAAKKMGKHTQEIAEEITRLYFADLDALGVDRSSMQFPRATQYIPEQIALVKTLLQKGCAYQISDGIYFDISKYQEYGRLGNINMHEQEAGARVEENKEKKNPHDFALWKFSKPADMREQEWESPWGTGFPGWHLECTAMIFTLLGEQIDIHIGGEDLAPIHHNNEIAQAEGATGKPFVRYWLHNAFITINGKKISKSLGNTVYLSEFADRGLHPRALRYLYLTAHYRTPMNFTWEAAEAANTALNRLTKIYNESQSSRSDLLDEAFLKEFRDAIADDLDTPKALALVWEHIKTLNRATLDEVDKILGLGLAEAKPSSKLTVKANLPEGIQALLDAREVARKHKNFEKADEIRKEIESAGYELKDTPEGPAVSKK